MSDNRVEEIENKTQKPKSFSYINNILKVMLVVIFVCIALLGGMLTYLQFSTYDLAFDKREITNYVTKENINDITNVRDNEIEMDIPADIVNTEVSKYLDSLNLPTYITIEGSKIDSFTNKIYINSLVHGFKVSFSCQLNEMFTNDKFIIGFTNVALGNKELALPEWFSNRLLNYFFGEEIPLVFDINQYVKYDYLQINRINVIGESCSVDMSVKEAWLIEQLQEIGQFVNKELLNLYKTSNNPAMESAAYYVENADYLTKENYATLIKDVIGEKEIIFYILLLASQEKVEGLNNQYEGLLGAIDVDEILTTKNALISDIIHEYSDKVFETFNSQYFMDEMIYYNQGQPYSFAENKSYTLQQVIEASELDIPKETYDKMAFCYNVEEDKLLISYKVDDNTYLILDEDDKYQLDNESYNNLYDYEDTGEGIYTDDIETWYALYGLAGEYLNTEKVYIRYMKNDDKYAFAIVSPDFSPQNYWVLAFVKENGSWDYLEKNISNIDEFSRKHSGFNLELVTTEIDTVTVYNLEENMYNVILEDLQNKGIIGNASDYTIDYCSYGDKFIAVMLSNGDEYIYKVSSVYLKSVYNKKDAIVYWSDVPEIIYIQEKPKEE